ncbi:MAG: hypothetical protein ACYDBP_04335 [Leptospirales bacterium]
MVLLLLFFGLFTPSVAMATDVPAGLSVAPSGISPLPGKPGEPLPGTNAGRTPRRPGSSPEPPGVPRISRFDAESGADDKWLSTLIDLRKSVILDTLRRQKAVLERSIRQIEPPPMPKFVAPPAEKKKPVETMRVIGVFGQKAKVHYNGSDVTVGVGSKIGDYTVASIDGNNVTFQKGSQKYTLKPTKAEKKRRGPGLVVLAVNGQVARVRYHESERVVTSGTSVGPYRIEEIQQTGIGVLDRRSGKMRFLPAPRSSPFGGGFPGVASPYRSGPSGGPSSYGAPGQGQSNDSEENQNGY